MEISREVRERGQKGFTLIELLVVMAILGLLASLAVPQFVGVLANARSSANETNLALLQSAVDLYISSENVAPSTVDNFQGLIDKKYLKAVPDSPVGYTRYTVIDGEVQGGELESGGEGD